LGDSRLQASILLQLLDKAKLLPTTSDSGAQTLSPLPHTATSDIPLQTLSRLDLQTLAAARAVPIDRQQHAWAHVRSSATAAAARGEPPPLPRDAQALAYQEQLATVPARIGAAQAATMESERGSAEAARMAQWTSAKLRQISQANATLPEHEPLRRRARMDAAAAKRTRARETRAAARAHSYVALVPAVQARIDEGLLLAAPPQMLLPGTQPEVAPGEAPHPAAVAHAQPRATKARPASAAPLGVRAAPAQRSGRHPGEPAVGGAEPGEGYTANPASSTAVSCSRERPSSASHLLRGASGLAMLKTSE
jgi:hypothetical protein